MNWLREYAFLSGWLALPLAIITAMIQTKGIPRADVNWSRLVIFSTFFVAFGLFITPGIDNSVKSACETLVFMLMGYMIVTSKQ